MNVEVSDVYKIALRLTHDVLLRVSVLLPLATHSMQANASNIGNRILNSERSMRLSVSLKLLTWFQDTGIRVDGTGALMYRIWYIKPSIPRSVALSPAALDAACRLKLPPKSSPGGLIDIRCSILNLLVFNRLSFVPMAHYMDPRRDFSESTAVALQIVLLVWIEFAMPETCSCSKLRNRRQNSCFISQTPAQTIHAIAKDTKWRQCIPIAHVSTGGSYQANVLHA